MSICEPLAAELRQEAKTTRRLLERAPEASFGWKPHEKSTPLGRLAGHVAELPSLVSSILTKEEVNFEVGSFQPFVPSSTAEVLERFDRNVAEALEALSTHGDEGMQETWRLRSGAHVLFEQPRASVLRTLVLSHFIHHRGQLSVYLRLLDVPVPSIYGPSADESPGA